MPHLFEFRIGKSIAHRLDPRCKFFLLCMISAGLVSASWAACISLLLLTLCLLKSMGMGLLDLARQLRYFILFLLLIIGVRGLAEPGPVLFSLFAYPVSTFGLTQGCLVAIRFFIIMILGLVFCVSTRPSELKAAAQWFLTPIPGIPEQRVGVMISLSLRFLPMIFRQVRESRQAIHARCGTRQKNPVKRMSTLSLSLLGKTFRSADIMAVAMEARCYTDSRTDPEFHPSGKEPLALALGICTTLCLIYF